MSQRTKTREARARVAEIQARIDAHVAAKDAANAKEARARKALTKFDVPATIQRESKAGETPWPVELTSLTKVHAAYYSGDRDKLEASIIGGDVKLDYGPGTSRGAKSLARILRVTDRIDSRALARLDRRIDGLNDERDALIKAMHERGAPMTVEAIAKHAVALYNLTRAIPMRYGGGEDYELTRMEREMSIARIHLDYTTGAEPGIPAYEGGPPVCSCSTCGHDRIEAAGKAKEAERIAALPRIRITKCPCGKAPHLSRTDHSRTFINDEMAETFGIEQGWVDRFPVTICPRDGKRYLNVVRYKADQEAAAKELEKRIKRDGVTWTCPDHDEPVKHHTLVQIDDYIGAAYVVCDESDEAHILAEVNPRAFAKWQRAHEESEDAA